MEEKKHPSQEFGKTLSLLLKISHQKSYALAASLSYDVSYISKWATGSMLPAAKHINTIVEDIAVFLVDSIEADRDETAKRELKARYHTDEPESLKLRISEDLLNAYNKRGNKKTRTETILSGSENNSKTIVNPRMLRRYLMLDRSAVPAGEPLKLAMMADLLSLGKEDKLGIADIENSFLFAGEKSDNEVHYLFSLDHENADVSFDALLIAALLTNYARLDFHIAYYRRVPCSLFLAVRGYCTHMSVIARNHRSILSNTSMDQGVATEAYDTLLFLEESQSSPLVSYRYLKDYLADSNYLNLIISKNCRFLLGKMDETFLPDDVFEELLVQLQGVDQDYYRKLHMMQKTAMSLSSTRVVMPGSTLRNYVLSGEIDFYGNTVKLDHNKVLQHLSYLKDFLNTPGLPLQFHIVDDSIIKDFSAPFRPCFYLSDNVSYIRLQPNAGGQICQLEEASLRFIFNDFFEWLWTAKRIGSLTTMIDINNSLQSYLDMLQLLK